MRLVEIIWNPTGRQLRQFAALCAIGLPLVAWLSGGSALTVGACLAAGVGLAVAGLARPRTLKPLFVALMVLAAPVGMVIGELAMLLAFFAVFVPMGVLSRLFKRDALQRKFDRTAKTYWQAKKRPSGPAGYYRQF
jgi:hypothetical protein